MKEKNLKIFTKQIPNFYSLSHPKKIVIFGYYLEEKLGLKSFNVNHLRDCYDSVSAQQPKNYSDVITTALDSGILIPKNAELAISGNEKQKVEEKFLGGKPLISIKDELRNLPSKMPYPEQSKYIDDILGCLKVQAWRASIIMTWILTLDHLQRYVLDFKKDLFNDVLQRNPNYKKLTINQIRDFEDIKDADFIVVLRTCGVIGSSQLKKLENRLDDRNDYAHPTDLELTDTMAISFIEDLVHNIILKIKPEK